MHTKTIEQLIQGLRAKEYSSVELTQHFLDRIAKHDPAINTVITLTAEQALQEAAAADKIIGNKDAPNLTGIPILHKDIFCTQGIKTSCASKMLDNFIAPYDATVVSKLRNAGTISMGKLNMDEFAMGASNETSFYGASKNPWDLECVPGGSSGGSAAAMAARLAAGSTGTDTGGSTRQPAAFCGITGLKPTYGLVSRWGMIAYASSLDQGGPMAISSECCAHLLQAMAGFDPKDSTSVQHEIPDYLADIKRPIKGLKIGIPKEFFTEKLDANIAKVIDTAIKELEKLGAVIKEVSLPNIQLAIPTYYIIAPAECSSNLSRFDGVRYGYRCDDAKDLVDFYERTRSEGFGTEVKRRILIGTYVLSSTSFESYYRKAQKVRKLIANDYLNAFKEVDIIASPTAPEVAFKLGAKNTNPVDMYLRDIYTSSVNLAGIPAVSIPAGFVNNLPVGLQLIGNFFAESTILNAAHQYQLVTDWHQQIPTAFV